MKCQKKYKDCYVVLEENLLSIGNAVMERVWELGEEIPAVLSVKNKMTGKEWCLTGEEDKYWLPGEQRKSSFKKSDLVKGKILHIHMDARMEDDFETAEEHMKIEVRIEYPEVKVLWVHFIYPGLPVLRQKLGCRIKEDLTGAQAAEAACVPVQFEQQSSLSLKYSGEDDYVDYLPLNPRHCKWTSVRFNDRTDYSNNLVKTEEGIFYRAETSSLQGNLCFIKEATTGEGLTLIKEGPTPYAYQGSMKHDFHIEGKNIFTCGWGFTEKDLRQHADLETYGSCIILWNGGEGEALFTLREYHRAIHAFKPWRDCFVMSNTWGDRSQDGRIHEEFLLKELEAARKLGVNYYQIDDGWQKGVTIGSVKSADRGGVWEGYYSKDEGFWEVNPERFPHGMEPIARAAKEKGISLGIWFSPDSSNDFSNWEKDASVIIGLYRKYGIQAYKIDGVKIRSKKGEENLRRFMQKALQETGKKIFFNLDTTAETRNGFYGKVQYGSLFLENRYTDWGNYYPHWTLRNLWMLSKYYPSYCLQAEVLNVKRNTAQYGEDVLAPNQCGIEYAFAVAMCANPLLWMELTGLDEESMIILGRTIQKYGKHQKEILGGTLLPIGQEPSGTGWTGFQSVLDEETGFVLIIKELNHQDKKRMKLWKLRGKTILLEKISGGGKQKEAEVDMEGEAVFELEGVFRYGLYKYCAKTG